MFWKTSTELAIADLREELKKLRKELENKQNVDVRNRHSLHYEMSYAPFSHYPTIHLEDIVWKLLDHLGLQVNVKPAVQACTELEKKKK